MDNGYDTKTPRAWDFLCEQERRIDNKMRRLASALEACDDCLEAKGLQGMLNDVQLERDLLHYLIRRVNTCTLSLDAVLLQQISRYRRRVQQLSRNWRLGRPVPTGYWEAEFKRAFLTELQGRYHAWYAGRPYYMENPRPHSIGVDIFVLNLE
jgi:hypothetical protein